MIGKNLFKHLNEFRRYVQNYQYERSETGLYFHRAGVSIGGVFTHWVTGQEHDVQSVHNLVVDQGLNHMLDVCLYTPGSQTTVPNWFMMLHSGSGTPTADLTAANYHSNLTEITSPTQGYSESTRVEWVPDAVDTVNTEITNAAAPSTFTIAASSPPLYVNGVGIVSQSAKGATSGTLVAVGKFTATRNLSDTDEFNVKYKIDFDAA